jgi:hypothetical protein
MFQIFENYYFIIFESKIDLHINLLEKKNKILSLILYFFYTNRNKI